MNKQTITLLLAAIIFLTFASCSDDDDYVTIPIRSVKATATVDLAKRANWKYYVGLTEYNYTVTEGVLTATPKSEDNMWYVGSHYWGYYGSGYSESGITGGGYYAPYGTTGIAVLRTMLSSPNYRVNGNENSSEDIWDQLDQSTPEKMLDADALTSWHETIASENIENVVLNHEHCMIEYTLTGFSEGMQPKLMSSKFEIKPYVADGITQAILAHPTNNTLELKVEDKTYKVDLGKIFDVVERSVRDVFYSFDVKYDKDATDDAKKLTIENIVTKKWSTMKEIEK